MTNELPKAYDPALIEKKWATYWIDNRIFEIAPDGAVTNPFVELLPPPNVTGRLHMGHMLNQTEMDILARWHRMSGRTSLWVPGTDHAGIATQMMVERQLATEGKKRTDFSREAFTEKVWAWKNEYGTAITDQMKRLGSSVDWSREYFTMDENLSVAVKEAFIRLYEEGLIYRGAYIVNWDPQLQTALSDLEVDNEERAGHLYHIRYELADGTGSITIATTRPETMLGDTAVAVNPTDERYTALVGKKLTLPLSATESSAYREIPIVADDWAKPEFGTGAVKVTPAHDPNDFALGKRHNLPSPSIMDTRGAIDLPGSPYHGLDRFAARKRIVEDLEASGHLVKIADHTLTLPISQRTGAIIEPRLSMQWFIAVHKQPKSGGLSLAQKAIAAVRSAENPDGPIRIVPENYTRTYLEWMNNLHDWCISRQLWWGHRIPAWHCNACNCITVARNAAEACSGCGITDIKQETDVLDMWVSSGILPFTVFGWDGTDTLTPDLAAFYPTSLLVTGFDILFFWVARMIMLSTHLMAEVPMPDGSKRTLADTVPFKEVYIHSLVRDANREKMSKTKGNVVDPIEIVTRYGTDAVRFTLASQASPGTDIAFNEARTEGYRAFANKIWNAARFLQMNLDRAREAGYHVTLSTPASSSEAESALKGTGFSPSINTHGGTGPSAPEGQFPLETRWIFSRLSAVAAEVARALDAYRFDEASSAVYQFFWGEFCDWYLELIKLRLNFDISDDPTTALTLTALVTTFDAALRLLSPFMPFLTEELWHALYDTLEQPAPAKSIALTRYPQAADFACDPASVAEMDTLQALIVTIRGLRKELAVPEKEAAPIRVFSLAGNAAVLAQANAAMLAKQARVATVEIAGAPLSGANARSTAAFDVAVLYERQIDVPAERERLLKDLARFNKGLEAADRQLSNDGFIARAPAAIIEGLRRQHAEMLALQQKTDAALAALPPA